MQTILITRCCYRCVLILFQTRLTKTRLWWRVIIDACLVPPSCLKLNHRHVFGYYSRVFVTRICSVRLLHTRFVIGPYYRRGMAGNVPERVSVICFFYIVSIKWDGYYFYPSFHPKRFSDQMCNSYVRNSEDSAYPNPNQDTQYICHIGFG